MNPIIKTGERLASRLIAASLVILVSSAGALAQFRATLNEEGNVVVLDTNGVEVDIADADPVGVRPDYCPGGSYYAFELQADKTELVLADCVTSSEQYTVEMQGMLDGPPQY